jgi:mono/diheme cytochrome c family protein
MKSVLKWIGYIVAGFIVVILLAVGTVYAITSSRMSKTYSPRVEPLSIPTDSASIARGRHLTESVGKCQACHGDNYAGKVVMDDPAFARLTSSNLTSGKGGIGGEYRDEDWVRAIRFGVGRDGKSLIFMPSEAFTHFNDTDLTQIIAYLKTVPPANMTITKSRDVGPIARIVSIVGGFPLLPASLIPADLNRPVVPEGPTAEYGKYLIETGGCTGCHGANLGGQKMGSTTTPNLTRSGELAKWTEADFVKVIRTGARPDGRILSAEMPWPFMKGLTETELSAMWNYLQAVTPAPVQKP